MSASELDEGTALGVTKSNGLCEWVHLIVRRKHARSNIDVSVLTVLPFLIP